MNDHKPDYGCDPVGDGTFRMIPSGDIVDRAERDKRLKSKRKVRNEILGISWDELERKQGGTLKRNV